MTLLFWVDLETTGLEPTRCQILEIVIKKALLEDPFKIDHLYSAILFHNGYGIDPFVIEMHTKSGLLDLCRDSSTNVHIVDDTLANLIAEIPVTDEKPILAGSSVWFDHAFIKYWLPQTASFLSHRHYDVSALKLECQSMGMPKFQKAEAHRAEADILESIEHAKACRLWLRDYWLGQV